MTSIALPRPSLSVRPLAIGARLLLGFVFAMSGLDGFLHFMPVPQGPISDAAMAFATGLAKSGYMFPLIKGTELLCGVLLLANRLVPLALVLLAPVLVNIVAFHAFLAPPGLPLALALLALEPGLAWRNRRAYGPLLGA